MGRGSTRASKYKRKAKSPSYIPCWKRNCAFQNCRLFWGWDKNQVVTALFFLNSKHLVSVVERLALNIMWALSSRSQVTLIIWVCGEYTSVTHVQSHLHKGKIELPSFIQAVLCHMFTDCLALLASVSVVNLFKDFSEQ